MGRNLRVVIGVQELGEGGRDIWKALLAEFLGVLFLVFVACGSTLKWDGLPSPSHLHISLAFGVTVATVVVCIAHVSGGHVNPAVTLTMLVTGKVSVLRAVLYILAQCVGGVVGAALLKAVTPEQGQGNLGLTTFGPGVEPVQAFGIEFLITFVLLFTVFAVCDGNRIDHKGSGPLAIGLAVATCHLFGAKYTGPSMNPARTFGPAVMTGLWTNHWVYWLGPILGGMAAGVLYQYVFKAPRVLMERDVPLLTIRNNDNKDGKEVVADRTTSI